MNKSQSKYFHTALLMDQALLALLEVKDFEYITVKEVCQKAGVNRSTFYLHYDTMNDLLAECLAYINQAFLSAFSHAPQAYLANIETAPLQELILISSEILKPYLSFILQHKSVFKAVYKNPLCMQADRQFENMSQHILRPILRRFHVPEKEQSYWIAFYIHGSMAIIREWINEDCRTSAEEIEAVLLRCIRPEISHLAPPCEDKGAHGQQDGSIPGSVEKGP